MFDGKFFLPFIYSLLKYNLFAEKVVKSLFGQKEDESTGIMFNENFIKYGSKEVHEVFQILSYDTYLLFTK